MHYTGEFKIDSSVATDIASNPNLKIASFDYSNEGSIHQISNSAFTQFAAGANLTDLAFCSGDINDAAVKRLASNTALRHFRLATLQLTDKGVYALVDNTTLTSLDLSINPVSGCVYDKLMANTNIIYLNVVVNYSHERQKLNR